MSDPTPPYGQPQQPDPTAQAPAYAQPQQPGYAQPPAQPVVGQPVAAQPVVVQQGYPQQPVYGQPMYQQTTVYASYPPQPKGFSITALVLGIVSFFFGFTFLVPIGAVIFGIIGIKREPSARGMSITGLVLGGLMLLVWAVLIVLWLFVAVLALGAATTYGTSTS